MERDLVDDDLVDDEDPIDEEASVDEVVGDPPVGDGWLVDTAVDVPGICPPQPHSTSADRTAIASELTGRLCAFMLSSLLVNLDCETRSR